MELPGGVGLSQQDHRFSEGDDQLKILGARLEKILSDLEHGTVSILHGRWGSGKTRFAKAWIADLERRGRACLYFDAFAADHLENPFAALARAFVKAAKAAENKQLSKAGKAASQMADAFAAAAPHIGLLGVKALSAGLIDEEVTGRIAETKKNYAVDRLTDSATLRKWLINYADEEKAFCALRESLKRLKNDLSNSPTKSNQLDSEGNEVRPIMIVIIDELDRCRPDFALGIIEFLKHFFSVEGIHYILVTNIDQLTMAVNARYQNGPMSFEYLQKFYDFVIHFENYSLAPGESNQARYVHKLMNSDMNNFVYTSGAGHADLIADLATGFRLTHRQIEKIISGLLISDIFSKKSSPRVDLLILLQLIMVIDYNLFSKIKYNNADLSQFYNLIAQNSFKNPARIDLIVNSMRFLTDSSFDKKSPAYSDFFKEFGMWSSMGDANRLKMLQTIANELQ
jgi:hypothetical protein